MGVLKILAAAAAAAVVDHALSICNAEKVKEKLPTYKEAFGSALKINLSYDIIIIICADDDLVEMKPEYSSALFVTNPSLTRFR